MNAFDQMRDALAVARQVNDAADRNADQMAMLIEGRLRNVNAYTLAKLKRKLRDFNIHTGNWKD